MDKIKSESSASASGSAQNADWEHGDGVSEDDFKPLTAEEAAQWRGSQVRISMARVLLAQALVGLLLGLVVGWMGRWGSAVSVWYGAAAVWFPAVVMALGMARGRLTKALSIFRKGSLAAVVFWEGVKVLLSVVLLVLAPRVLNQVDWLALLAGLVVVIKVNGVALWWVSRVPRKVN